MCENQYPHIETAEDYREYEADVASFLEDMEGEPSTGYWECPECGSDNYSNGDGCPVCGIDAESYAEPHFSWARCDCCDRDLGGDREDMIGWTKGARESGYDDEHRWTGAVCVDCAYYFAYGQLDDMTMLKID